MIKSYSYIQVLISLYDEYLKNEIELRKLKLYTQLEDDKINDYYFRCAANQLLLDRDIKKSKLKKLMEIINNRVDLTTVDVCQKDSNENYIIKKGMYKVPTIINQSSFNEQAEKIMKSSFLQNFNYYSIPISNGHVCFTSGGIHMRRDNYHNSCSYYSKDNILIVKSSSKITNYSLFELLNSQISKSNLNYWHQELIEKNDNQIQEIIYPEISTRCHQLTLSIDKRKSKVLLKQI